MSAVVHVVVAGEVGGAERMLVDLARGADAHSIALFTPSERLRALFADAGLSVDDRGTVREGPLSYLVRSLGPLDVAWLTQVIRRRRASIVHLHTFASQVLGTRAAMRAGAQIVRTEHSTRVYDDPSCWPFSRWSLARAGAIVSISEHVACVARARAPWVAERMRVVGNGVDTARFAPREGEGAREESDAREESERRAGTGTGTGTGTGMRGAGGETTFVSLGRLDRRKGVDIALAALTRVPRARLEIVGDGEERAALVALAARLGVSERVRFVGWVEDVRTSIAAADVALSSARAEGLGIALLEAMAIERPVVALPTGGVPEIVSHGDTGWLAHAQGPAALARMMQDAVDRPDEVRRRGARARAQVEARFSLEAMRRGYADVYAMLTGGPPPP